MKALKISMRLRDLKKWLTYNKKNINLSLNNQMSLLSLLQKETIKIKF